MFFLLQWCFVSHLLTYWSLVNVEQQDRRCAWEAKVVQLIVVPDVMRFLCFPRIFLFSLSLVSHSTGTCTCVNLWEGDIVLSEDCLPGKEGSLLLMLSTRDFFAPLCTWDGIRDPRIKQVFLGARVLSVPGWTTEGAPSGGPWRKSLRDFLRDTHPACCSSEPFSSLFASALAGITASPQRPGGHD